MELLLFSKTSDPQSRPSFQELLDRLRDLQRQYTIQFQQARNTAGDGSQKESWDPMFVYFWFQILSFQQKL